MKLLIPIRCKSDILFNILLYSTILVWGLACAGLAFGIIHLIVYSNLPVAYITIMNYFATLAQGCMILLVISILSYFIESFMERDVTKCQ